MQAINLAPPSLPLQLALTFAVSPKNTRPALPPSQTCFTVPDVSPTILGRLVRLYKDVCWRSLNDRGGCYARRHRWKQLYGVSPDTVRRWLVLLEECGWIKRVVSGPNRLIIPLVAPDQVARVLPQFRRLFSGLFKRLPREILSGFRDPAPLSLDREISNNKPAPRAPAKPLPALSAEERAVVVASVAVGVAATAAERLVREAGAPAVRDAIDVLAYYQERAGRGGKPVENAGGLVREAALNLAKGLWSLPAAILRARERAERKAERDKRARERRVQAPAAPPATSPPPAPPSDLARLLLLPEAEVAALEKDARAAMEAKGGAAAWMVGRLQSSWRERAGEILRKEMVRLLDEKEKGKKKP